MRTFRLAGACIVGMVLLTACSEEEAPVQEAPAAAEESEPAEDMAEETTTEEETAEETSEAPTDAAPETAPAPEGDTAEETEDAGGEQAGGDVTAPGTALALGETARVEYTYGEGTGLMDVTITAIEEGDPADLDPLELGDQVAGLTPYYVQIEVSGVDASSEALTYADVTGAIDGLLGDGSGAQSLTIIGDFEPCDSNSLDEFGEGVTATTCSPWLAGEGSAVEGAQFAPYEGPYNTFDGEPILWAP